MSNKFSYEEYVRDQPFLTDYNAYQAKYAKQMRESDRVILEIAGELLLDRRFEGAPPALLDIGCSTGNLLLHLNRAFPERFVLTGGDLAESSIEDCRANPELTGIAFEELDILDLPEDRFDIVSVNAVLYMFDDAQYDAALKSIRRALRPGGAAILYDFAHEFGQEIEILEKTESHPNGLRIGFRSQESVRKVFNEAGFPAVEFRPFELPIDLPRPRDDAAIITYTRKDELGRRMAFRGVLYQPWCHMIARKPA